MTRPSLRRPARHCNGDCLIRWISRTSEVAVLVLLLLLALPRKASGQGVAQGSAPPPGAKSIKCQGRTIPQLEDITAKAGLRFSHTSAPGNRYIAESMSGGVLLLDYDRDGWVDIYFTNAPTVEMANKGEKSRSALYHNNHDGTFTDVSDRSGVGYGCGARGLQQ